MARLEVALRSPLAFWRLPSGGFSPSIDLLKQPPETVGIEFEGREFVWHPPIDRADHGLGPDRLGPMVSVVTKEDEREAVATGLQRFLSAVAFLYDRPVEDVHYAGAYGPGSGEPDPYHSTGPRAPRSFPGVEKHDAPAAIEVEPSDDPRLRVALAYYREGLNTGSPFYRFLAFWNVLAATFEVEDENTIESDARDTFIRKEAPRHAARDRRADPVRHDVAAYFRDEARNAIAHVVRTRGREVDPDDPTERVRLVDDASWLRQVARAAIDTRWPRAVRPSPRASPRAR